MSNPSDEKAARKAERRYFLSVGGVQDSITEYATQHLAKHPLFPNIPQAFVDATIKVKLDLMHLASHPDSDQEEINIGAAPWPAYDTVYAETLVEEAPEPQEPTPDSRDEAIAAAEAELAALRARVAELEAPEPEPEPEHHFADLMLADETIDDARARLSQRLRELRHYLIAPEIKVNEDGSVGLTAGEQSELQDLERRQTLGRWLEA